MKIKLKFKVNNILIWFRFHWELRKTLRKISLNKIHKVTAAKQAG